MLRDLLRSARHYIKNFVLYLLKKNEKKKYLLQIVLMIFNNLRMNDILKNMSCCKF